MEISLLELPTTLIGLLFQDLPLLIKIILEQFCILMSASLNFDLPYTKTFLVREIFLF